MSSRSLWKAAVLRRSIVTLAVAGALIPAAAIAAPTPSSSAGAPAAGAALDEHQVDSLLRATPSTVRSRPARPERTSRLARPAVSRSVTAGAASGPDRSSVHSGGPVTPAVAGPAPERVNTRGTVFASVGKQQLVLPDGVVGVGFHESGTSKALPMVPIGRSTANHNDARVVTPAATEGAAEYFVLPTRARANGGTTAVDIRVKPDVPVTAPVTGKVDAVTDYALYGKYNDVIVEIIPTENPDLRVRMLHIEGVGVTPGAQVTAGETVIAAGSRQLAFASQIDRFAGQGPHVHVEVHLNPAGVAEAKARTAAAREAAERAEAEKAEAEQKAKDRAAKDADDAERGRAKAESRNGRSGSAKPNTNANANANANANF